MYHLSGVAGRHSGYDERRSTEDDVMYSILRSLLTGFAWLTAVTVLLCSIVGVLRLFCSEDARR